MLQCELLNFFFQRKQHTRGNTGPWVKYSCSYFILCCIGILDIWWQVICHAQCFPIESRDRQKKLYEVGFVTGIFCTCFLIRCIAVAVSAFEKSADFDVLNNPILHLIYYMASF